MKMRCKWLYLCMSVLVVFSMSKMVTNAMNTGFSTKELSEERRYSFAENVNISSLSKEPVHKSIQCFDVNEKGMVAIGQQDVYGTEVCVYNSSKEFLYGYYNYASYSLLHNLYLNNPSDIFEPDNKTYPCS